MFIEPIKSGPLCWGLERKYIGGALSKLLLSRPLGEASPFLPRAKDKGDSLHQRNFLFTQESANKWAWHGFRVPQKEPEVGPEGFPWQG